MPFNQSVLGAPFQPWRYTTQPTTAKPDGVKETLTGVCILLDDAVLEYIYEVLTAAQKTAFSAYVTRYSTETPLPVGHLDAGLWHVPMWAGETRATVVRIPANIWSSPSVAPPAIIKTRFRKLFRD